jgi:hypothetical protein
MYHDAFPFVVLPTWRIDLPWERADVKIGPSEKRNTMLTRQIMTPTNAKRTVMNSDRFRIFRPINAASVPTMTMAAHGFSNTFYLPAYAIQEIGTSCAADQRVTSDESPTSSHSRKTRR